jgi:hypothetical protein
MHSAARWLVATYDDFIEVLYKDIDDIVSSLQENPELYQKDRSEDRITVEIKKMLNHMGYDAAHDVKHGGHTDLLVKKDVYIWIGEAKIHSSYDYLWQGFQQLTTRYSSGDSNQKDGGLLIYIFQKDAKTVMDEWMKHLSSKNLEGYTSETCKKRSLSFFSNHRHTKSGLIFRTRHIPVMFHFDPKDRRS